MGDDQNSQQEPESQFQQVEREIWAGMDPTDDDFEDVDADEDDNSIS